MLRIRTPLPKLNDYIAHHYIAKSIHEIKKRDVYYISKCILWGREGVVAFSKHSVNN